MQNACKMRQRSFLGRVYALSGVAISFYGHWPETHDRTTNVVRDKHLRLGLLEIFTVQCCPFSLSSLCDSGINCGDLQRSLCAIYGAEGMLGEKGGIHKAACVRWELVSRFTLTAGMCGFNQNRPSFSLFQWLYSCMGLWLAGPLPCAQPRGAR